MEKEKHDPGAKGRCQRLQHSTQTTEAENRQRCLPRAARVGHTEPQGRPHSSPQGPRLQMSRSGREPVRPGLHSPGQREEQATPSPSSVVTGDSGQQWSPQA